MYCKVYEGAVVAFDAQRRMIQVHCPGIPKELLSESIVHLIRAADYQSNVSGLQLFQWTEEIGDIDIFRWSKSKIVEATGDGTCCIQLNVNVQWAAVSKLAGVGGSLCLKFDYNPFIISSLRNAVNNIDCVDKELLAIVFGCHVYRADRSRKFNVLDHLNIDQCHGVASGLHAKFTAVQGGPGFGKTIVSSLIPYHSIRKLCLSLHNNHRQQHL